jgi:hypothetical protein
LYQKGYIWNLFLLTLLNYNQQSDCGNASDEPLVNKSFDSLDQLEEVLAERCCVLSQMDSQIQALTSYHWWPDPETLETG